MINYEIIYIDSLFINVNDDVQTAKGMTRVVITLDAYSLNNNLMTLLTIHKPYHYILSKIRFSR